MRVRIGILMFSETVLVPLDMILRVVSALVAGVQPVNRRLTYDRLRHLSHSVFKISNKISFNVPSACCQRRLIFTPKGTVGKNKNDGKILNAPLVVHRAAHIKRGTWYATV